MIKLLLKTNTFVPFEERTRKGQTTIYSIEQNKFNGRVMYNDITTVLLNTLQNYRNYPQFFCIINKTANEYITKVSKRDQVIKLNIKCVH